MVSRSIDLCVQNMWLVLGRGDDDDEPLGLVGGRLKRRGHKLMVWAMDDTVGVCNYKKVGFDGPVCGVGVEGGYGFSQRGEEDRGGMGHRLIDDAYWMSHQGFFRGNESNLAL